MVYYFIATPDCGPSFTYCPRVRPPFAAFFYLRLTQRRENRLLTLDRLCLQYSISIWYRVMPTLFLQLMHKLFGIWRRLTPVASLPTKQANKISIEPCSFPYYDGFFFILCLRRKPIRAGLSSCARRTHQAHDTISWLNATGCLVILPRNWDNGSLGGEGGHGSFARGCRMSSSSLSLSSPRRVAQLELKRLKQ